MADAMVEDQEATTYCSNCKRDIPNQNFQMHDLHCHRNVRLCKKCQEPVPISEMEEHNEEFHAMVECKCKEMVEKAQLENHEKHCSHRTVHCQYCEMDMKYIDLPEHEHACGSRTEKCQDCGEFIMLKNAIQHVCNPVVINKNFNDFNSDVFQNNYPGYSENITDIPDHVVKYYGDDVRPRGAAFDSKKLFSDNGFSSRTSSRRPDDPFTANFQDLGINEDNSQEKTAENNIKRKAAAEGSNNRRMVIEGRKVDINRISRPTRGSEKFQRTKLKHSSQTKTQSKVKVIPIDVDQPEKSEEKPWEERYQENKGDVPDPFIVIPEDQNFGLPCEICEELVPMDELQTHQESCLLAQQEAFKSYRIENAIDDPEPQDVVVVDDDQDDAVATIPCEFCKESFHAENIIMHQPYCNKNPQKHDNQSEERNEFWQPMTDESDEFVNRRLQEFSTEFERTERNISVDPFTNTTVTESFARFRSNHPFMSDNMENQEEWYNFNEGDNDETSERSERHSRR